jgi:hypothetical protein
MQLSGQVYVSHAQLPGFNPQGTTKKNIYQAGCSGAVIPVLGRQRQKDLEFKAKPGYIASSRPG